ncbi:MAG: cytochrome c biogenesis protein ResB, partial [Brevibacterium sp.]|nr:cytochrome c biogenesis protein ResB [Brevibacterium sp.]
IDAENMTEMTDSSGNPLLIQLTEGETQQLPDGGSVTFDGIKRYIAVDISQDPTQGLMLASAIAVLLGLGLSLFIPRRRMWVRIKDGQAEVAALARGEDPMVERATKDLAKNLTEEWANDSEGRAAGHRIAGDRAAGDRAAGETND